MKISFRGRFRSHTWAQIKFCEIKLNDIFLVFLPNKLEIAPIGDGTYGQVFEIKMVTKKLFTLEDIIKKLDEHKIKLTDISHVKREFTDEELEQVKKSMCFKEIFNPTEMEMKKQ